MFFSWQDVYLYMGGCVYMGVTSFLAACDGTKTFRGGGGTLKNCGAFNLGPPPGQAQLLTSLKV